MTGRLLWVLLWLLLLAALPLTGLAQSTDDEERAIARELQCPVCENLSVADSPSQLALQMREVIRHKLEAGESRDDILRYFAARYGEGILLSPPRSGFTLVVWTAPYLGLAAAVGFLLWAVRRRAMPPADRGTELALGPGAAAPTTGDGLDLPVTSPRSPTLTPESDLDPYLSQVDATVDRLRDEPVR